MALFKANIAKVGGNRLGIYLPNDICQLADLQRGDTFVFSDPKAPRGRVVSWRCDVERKVRPKGLIMLMGSIDDIAQKCAEAFFAELKVTPLTSADKRDDLIFDNRCDAWLTVQSTLESEGCPWSTVHELHCERGCDGEGEFCDAFDLEHEELRRPFWSKFDDLIASQLGDNWRQRYDGL